MTRALIIVDVQNDFCEGGSLAVTGGAAVAAGISSALSSSTWDHVVATKDHHIDPGAHFGNPPDYITSWPAHCRVDTPGVEFHPALDTSRVEAVFYKGEHAAAYSGFEGFSSSAGEREERAPASPAVANERPIALSEWLRSRSVTAVDVVGIATDHCVRATALDAAREGFDTTVLLGLTAGVAPETTERALVELREAGIHLQGSPLVTG